MKQSISKADCINYYYLLRLAGESIPLWLTGKLALTYFIDPFALEIELHQ